MRFALISFLLAAGVQSSMSAENSTANRIAALKEAFRYNPVVPTDPLLTAPTEPEPVMLEALTITESMSRRALARQIQDRWRDEAAQQFNWKKGGLLFTKYIGKNRLDFGAWVTLGDRTLGSASPSREIFVKVDLLRFRW